jgi:hypothetical protein
MWIIPESKDMPRPSVSTEAERLKLISEGCDPKTLYQKEVNRDPQALFGEVSKTHNAIQTLDKTISSLEMELAAARSAQESLVNGAPISNDMEKKQLPGKRRYLMVVGINTAFSSRKRRDSVRTTWMPSGEKRKKLEEEKGIIIRFVIGHSATAGGILDRSIEAEDKKHGDFLRLDHVEGYLELSGKTKTYFSTAVSKWDAEFYVKVDDDVHVNIATLGETLVRHRKKHRVYLGCMKSGPVLSQKYNPISLTYLLFESLSQFCFNSHFVYGAEELDTMSLSIGNLVRMETSTSVTLLDSYTPFLETWLLTFPLISMFCTNMQMRMLH